MIDMARPLHANFAQFYEDVALYPRVGRFRRFKDLWAKKIYDDTEAVHTAIRNVEDAFAKSGKRVTNSGSIVLDFPRSVAAKECPDSSGPWKDYEEVLKKQGTV